MLAPGRQAAQKKIRRVPPGDSISFCERGKKGHNSIPCLRCGTLCRINLARLDAKRGAGEHFRPHRQKPSTNTRATVAQGRRCFRLSL